MSISKRIRAKVASSISRIDETETFLWLKLLRPVNVDFREIESFISELLRTEYISLEIDTSTLTLPFSFDFNKVKTFKLTQRKLLLKSKTNPVFFDFGNISVSNIKISFDQDLRQTFAAKIIVEGTAIHFNIKEQKKKEISGELTSEIINLEKHLLKSDSFSNKSKPSTEGTRIINYYIKEPEIIDCLSTLKPEIYNLKLLTRLEHTKSDGPIVSTKIELLDKTVPLKKIDNQELKLKEEQLSSPFEFNPQIAATNITLHGDLFPWNAQQAKIKIPGFDEPVKTELSVFYGKDSSEPSRKERATKAFLVDEIDKIIQPKMNISQDEEEFLFKGLYPFQIKGAKFLASNSKVLLSNALQTGKTVQAIFGIRYLIKKREIKHCLVVTDENSINNNSISSNAGSRFDWLGILKKFTPEISSSLVNSKTPDINTALSDKAQIQIISYEMLLQALGSGKLKKDLLKNLQCLILDNVERAGKYQNEIVQIIDLIRPKFNWIITNLNKEDYAENISRELNPEILLSHKFDEIRPQLPDIIESDYWIDLEKEHRDEFNQALFHAKNSLQDILATGNPFRFQSQLFSYIHQLLQVSNFPADNIESEKTKILLNQIDSVRSFNKKAVIFSQYDKAGIQKLTKLFEREGISYRKYSQGMTATALTRAIIDFEKDASITALLADTQAIKAQPYIGYAPYIIHFDQWWTPVLKWDLENRIRNLANKPITILNYFTVNTLDERIQSLLFTKGMLDRQISGNIGADAFSKILSEEEWTKIFELEKLNKPSAEKDNKSQEKN
jgi:hypothetical protein